MRNRFSQTGLTEDRKEKNVLTSFSKPLGKYHNILSIDNKKKKKYLPDSMSRGEFESEGEQGDTAYI